MGKAVVEVHDCTMRSAGGFGVWVKHNGTARLRGCAIDDVARTGIACFNQGVVEVTDTTISRAGVHGVCLRGTGAVRLERVVVDGCAVRGCYVYQQGALEMRDCEVRGTVGPEEPAVQAGDTAKLGMERCRVHSNAGLDLKASAEVDLALDDETSMVSKKYVECSCGVIAAS